MSTLEIPAASNEPDNPEVGIREVKLEELCLDEGTKTRARLYANTVREYAATITEAGRYVFPPVVAYEDTAGRLLLADGFHRCHAAKQAGLERIPTLVKRGTRFDAFQFNLTANANHGLRRTNADKRRAVELAAREAAFANSTARELARICCVHHDLVIAVRKAMETDDGFVLSDSDKRQLSATTVGGDGKVYRSKKLRAESAPLPPDAAEFITAETDTPTCVPKLENGTLKGGAKPAINNDQSADTPPVALPGNEPPVEKPLTGSTDEDTPSFDDEPSPASARRKGFRLSNGQFLPFHPCDDSTITQTMTQHQLDKIKWSYENVDLKLRGGSAAALEQQLCVVELVRTLNRFLSVSGRTSETAWDSCVEATGGLRPLLGIDPAKTRKQELPRQVRSQAGAWERGTGAIAGFTSRDGMSGYLTRLRAQTTMHRNL